MPRKRRPVYEVSIEVKLTQYLDVGIDAIALLCIVESWLFILLVPVSLMSLPIWIPDASIRGLAIISSISALVGFLLKWIGKGVSKRKRGWMALLTVACLLIAFAILIPSRRPKQPKLYVLAVVNLGVASLLVSGMIGRRVGL